MDEGFEHGRVFVSVYFLEERDWAFYGVVGEGTVAVGD